MVGRGMFQVISGYGSQGKEAKLVEKLQLVQHD